MTSFTLVAFEFSCRIYIASFLLLKLYTEFSITSIISLKYVKKFLANNRLQIGRKIDPGYSVIFINLSQENFVFVFDLRALLFKRIAYFHYFILLLAKCSLKIQSLQPQPFCLYHPFSAALHIHLFLSESLLLAVFVFCYIKTRTIISSVFSFHGCERFLGSLGLMLHLIFICKSWFFKRIFIKKNSRPQKKHLLTFTSYQLHYLHILSLHTSLLMIVC